MKILTDFLAKKEGGMRKDLAALLIVFGAALFQFLGRIPLLEPDEGRYAEIPREMLERGDFVTPYLNHVKYFEKPPLLYWLNSLSISIFGQNEFAARFFPALSGLAGILLTYFIGRKIYGRREGLLAAIVLGTSVGYLAQARMNIIDMPLTFCMTASLGFFLLAVREGEKRRGFYFYLFYFFAALTVLAKGLIGIVLPGAVIFLYLVVKRQWKVFREMKLFTGGILFLLVAAPWFIVVSARNPEFARFFFIHEHFERYLTKVHGHYKPVWYFIPVLLGCMFPWSLFLPSVVRRVWLERSAGKFDQTLFLVMWASIIFCFFSLSDSKLIPYIIPVFPPVAILLGRTLVAVFDDGCGSISHVARMAASIVVLIGAGALLYPILANSQKLDIRLLLVLGPILLIGGTASLLCVCRNRGWALFAVLAGMSLLVSVAGPPFIFGRLAERKAAPDLARIVSRDFREGDTIACYGWYQQGLPFYAGKRVVVVGYKGELEFGSNQGDNSDWFIDYAAFSRKWDSPVRVFALVRDRDMGRLTAGVKSPVNILGRKSDMVLVSNR